MMGPGMTAIRAAATAAGIVIGTLGLVVWPAAMFLSWRFEWIDVRVIIVGAAGAAMFIWGAQDWLRSQRNKDE